VARRAEEIVRLGLEYRDHVLVIACPRCGSEHEARLPGVIMVAEPECPGCGHRDVLEPVEIERALDRLLPPLDVEAAVALDARVADIVARWTDVPGVRECTLYEGIDLGATAAFDLLPLVVEDLLVGETLG